MKFFWLFILLSSFKFIEEQPRFITEREFRACCQFRIDDCFTPFFPFDVRDGDLIFVNPHCLPHFFTSVQPLIRHRFILVTHGAPFFEFTPEFFFPQLDNPNLIAWFGCHIERCRHPKFRHIPCGIREFPGGVLEAIKFAESCRRTILLLMNFNPLNRCLEPDFIQNFFRFRPLCTFGEFGEGDNVKFFEDLAHSEFVLCPRAPFVDHHLIWESLLMGAIPIVRTSDCDHLFKDLPVLIIKDWSEITPEFLEKKLRKFRKKKFSLEKLRLDFWIREIDDCRHHRDHLFELPHRGIGKE